MPVLFSDFLPRIHVNLLSTELCNSQHDCCGPLRSEEYYSITYWDIHCACMQEQNSQKTKVQSNNCKSTNAQNCRSHLSLSLLMSMLLFLSIISGGWKHKHWCVYRQFISCTVRVTLHSCCCALRSHRSIVVRALPHKTISSAG